MAKQRDIAALIEDAEWIADTGGDRVEAARRLGLHVDHLTKVLCAAGRGDVVDRLKANRTVLNEEFNRGGSSSTASSFARSARAAS